MIISPEVALARLLDLVKFRSIKRRNLFETECVELCDLFLKHQEYLISEIDTIIGLTGQVRPLLDSLAKSNDWEPIILEIESRINKLRSEIRERRHKGRAERIKVHKLARNRDARVYFKDDVINYISTSEREAMDTFFSSIADYYERGQRYHSHDLSGALDTLRWFLEEVLNPDHGETAYRSRERLVEDFDRLCLRMKQHRENAQLSYGEISALLDRVRIRLSV